MQCRLLDYVVVSAENEKNVSVQILRMMSHMDWSTNIKKIFKALSSKRLNADTGQTYKIKYILNENKIENVTIVSIVHIFCFYINCNLVKDLFNFKNLSVINNKIQVRNVIRMVF